MVCYIPQDYDTPFVEEFYMDDKTVDFPAKRRGRPPGSKDVVPRKPRADKLNFGEENVQQGDNSRYLRHALATLGMPPIDISDPRQVEDRIDWYFLHCAENEMKPTVKGLCNSLGIPRVTLMEWRQGNHRPNTHQAIILRAYDVLEELWENYMLNGKINPVSGIFLGKNQWNYQDKQEYVVTPNTGGIQEADVATIEAKYAELPED